LPGAAGIAFASCVAAMTATRVNAVTSSIACAVAAFG
jgi:hypothetical protein